MKNISKLFAILLVGVMLLSFASCGLIDSIFGTDEPPVNEGGENEGGENEGGENGGNNGETEVKDYTITFHYGLAEGATLDENGKASAYAATKGYTSKGGKRISLTSAMKELFAVDGHKLIGYSTKDWQKDGISADMDVYVLYEALGFFTVTFQNPDGSVISTLDKKEGESLATSEYPAVSEVEIAEGYEFIAWDINGVDSVASNVVVKAIQGISRKFEAESVKSAVYDNANEVLKPTGAVYSGGSYVHCEYKGAQGFASLTWELQSDEATTAILSMAMAHRANKYYYINQCIQVFVNDVQVDVFSDSIFTVEGWGQDTNGDGTNGAYGKFEEFNVASINLVSGKNTITVKTIINTAIEFDYFYLKGSVEGVYMHPYNLTLNGATFANGKTASKVEAGGALPAGIQMEIPAGKKLSGWTDGTNTWSTTDFVMPEADVTLSPVFVDKVSPEKNVNVIDTEVSLDGVKDDAYFQVNSAAGHLEHTKDKSISGTVYMVAKDNGVYVYIEVTDSKVVSRGLEAVQDGSLATGFKNDMIEFWFQYGDIHSKIQLDAFGLSLKSIADGLATSFENLDKMVYATRIIGDDLAGYTEGDPYVSESATGYAVEFWLPLAEEGTSVTGSTLTWTLQINSTDSIQMNKVSVYGWKMKTEAEMLELDKIFNANFVATKKIEAESGTATYYDASGNATDAKVMKKPENAVFSGGAYAHYEYWGAYPTATIVYNINATADETLNLAIMLGHRAAEFNKINSVFKVYVNGTELVISDDHVFTLEGWGQDTNGDGTKGAYNVFEDFNLGNITLQEGNNEIKFEISAKYPFEIDYFTLSGNTSVLAEESAA